MRPLGCPETSVTSYQATKVAPRFLEKFLHPRLGYDFNVSGHSGVRILVGASPLSLLENVHTGFVVYVASYLMSTRVSSCRKRGRDVTLIRD